MYHFRKNNSKIFSPEWHLKYVWRAPHKNVFPGPAVAFDGPEQNSQNIKNVKTQKKLQKEKNI